MPVWAEALGFGLALLFILVGLGVPMAFSMGLVGFAGLFLFAGPDMALNFLNIIALTATPNVTLAAIPLFVLMAELLVVSGIGERAYDSVTKLMSGVPGSLAVATNGAGALLAAVMGSSAASCATLGRLGLPEMRRRGYSDSFATGALCGAGGLAVIIPPSMTAIIYSFVMEVPVLKMFAAGILPGLLMAAGYMLWAVVRARTRPDEVPFVPSLSIRERFGGGLHVLPILALVGIVLGSMYSGLASVTESAAFGVVGAFLFGLIYLWHARASCRVFGDSLRSTALTTGFILVIIVGALYFTQFWVYTGVTKKFAEYTLAAQVSPLVLLLISNLVLLVLGCLMDTMSLLLVVIPIFASTLAAMGMNPIWLGNIYLINMETALITPPVGYNLFVIKGLSQPYGISFATVSRGALPYVLINLVVIGLVIAFPELALWLARVLG